MKDFISIYNVPISLEERICAKQNEGTLYINEYSWVVVMDGYYEFYYTPRHFIGKIKSSHMPSIVIDRLGAFYRKFPCSEVRYGYKSRVSDKASNVRFRNLSEQMGVGTWYHAQGQNVATYDNKIVWDDMYVANCERECNFSEIDGAAVYNLVRMGCQTRTPYYYKGLFDFPCFRGVDTKDIMIYPFYGENWNAKYWIERFETHSKCAKQYKESADEIHGLRADVFTNTVNIVKCGNYTTETGLCVELPDDSAMIKGTVFYDKEITAHKITNQFLTQIEVMNIDCLLAAKDLQDQGYNVAVLNMASRQNPGGGVYTGAGAQEENLFRRTNLFRSMFQFAPYAPKYGLVKSNNQYPLDRNFGGVYTPNATVFRGLEKDGYNLLDKPYQLSFIAVPGINRPELDSNGMIANNLIEPVKNKIRTILRIGLINDHNALVLGALGCGAFCNPPKHIAHLFHEVIDESEFKNKFKYLLFAIAEDHNSYRDHNNDGNIKPFDEEFCA